MESFATAADYEALYGAVDEDDRARLDALLLTATGYLLSYLPGYTKGDDEVLDLNAKSICCAMVHRALSVPDGLEGVSQYQQTAGSYSASVSLLDQYMRPLASELEILGVGDASVVASVRMDPSCG